MRDLSDHERAVLLRLLAEEFPGADQLREQVRSAKVVGDCTCGCPTIDIEVAGEASMARVESRTPVSARVEGAPDQGLIVFVDDGRLSGLELYGAWETAPAEFPEVARIQSDRP